MKEKKAARQWDFLALVGGMSGWVGPICAGLPQENSGSFSETDAVGGPVRRETKTGAAPIAKIGVRF